MAIINGVTTGTGTEVDTVPKASRSSLYDILGNALAVLRASNTPATPSGLPMAGVNGNSWRVLRLDRIGSVRTGFDNLLLHDDVEGATLNTQLWNQVLTGYTITQTTATGIEFNAGNTFASGSNATLISQKEFSKTQLQPLRMRKRARIVPQTNAIHEIGFGKPNGIVAQIPTGAFWRYTSSGALVPVIAYNGSDSNTGTDISGLINSANYYTWGVIVDDDNVLFTVQDVSTGRVINEQALQIPLSQPKMFSATHVPVFVRSYIGGTAAPAAPKIFLSDSAVVGLDLFVNKQWSHQVALANAGGAEVNPSTFAQTENNTNSTAPASATLSNTAAGYTTKGGKFQFVAVAGAETDYALFAFTVPSPYTFVCTGIHIDAYNTVVAVATTATLLEWAVANNSSAVSLATAGLTRTVVGVQSFAIGAAVGAQANVIDLMFDAPLRTEGSRIMHVIVKMPIGTATATEIFRGQVMLKGYFE